MTREQTDLMRMICICLMTLTHVQFSLGHLGYTSIEPLVYGVARISTALLGGISGILFALAIPSGAVGKRLVRRLRNLLIPYFLWNAITATLYYSLDFKYWYEPAHFLFILGKDYPVNGPLHYLFDIAQCVIAASLIVVAARGNKAVMVLGMSGFVATIGVWAALDLPWHEYIPRSDMTLFYGLAFMCGLFPEKLSLGFKLLCAHRFKLLLVCFAGFVLAAYMRDFGPDLLQRLFGSAIVVLLVAAVQRPPSWASARLAFRLFVSHFIVFELADTFFHITGNPSLFWFVIQPLAAIAVAVLSIRIEDATRSFIATARAMGRVTEV